MSTFETLDDRFKACVKATARLDHLYDDCRWAEGPAYFPAHRALVWSDIPNNRMLRYDEAAGPSASSARRPATRTATPWTRRAGSSLRARPPPRHPHRARRHDHRARGELRRQAPELAQRRRGPQRRRGLLHRPVLRHRGLVRGLRGRAGTRRLLRLPDRPDHGRARIVTDDMDRPNGLAFSLDERCCTSATRRVKNMRVFDVDDGGGLRNDREFATCTVGGFDGFRLDDAGRIWTSAGDGVHVYDPDGTCSGRCSCPRRSRTSPGAATSTTASTSARRRRCTRSCLECAERRRCSRGEPSCARTRCA